MVGTTPLNTPRLSTLPALRRLTLPASDTAILFQGKTLPTETDPAQEKAVEKTPKGYRKGQLMKALRNILLIPVLPFIGYFGLDATGVTESIAQKSPAMERILGEGFGHAGLCFSLHYVMGAGSHLWRAAKGKPPKKETEKEAE